MNFVTQSTFMKIDFTIRYGYVVLSFITFWYMHLTEGEAFHGFLLVFPCVVAYPYYLLSCIVRTFSDDQYIRPFAQNMPHFEVFIQCLFMIGFYYNPFELDMRIFMLPHCLIALCFIQHFRTFKSIFHEKE